MGTSIVLESVVRNDLSEALNFVEISPERDGLQQHCGCLTGLLL